MADSDKRLRYYKGQFLQEEDFTAEQEYHLDRQRRHNRQLHTWGIAEGLTVTVGATSAEVSPGTAIDGEGRQIVLIDPRTVPFDSLKGSVLVVISYNEKKSDPATMGGGEETRWLEQPVVEVIPETGAPPADLGIRLARLQIAGDGTVSEPDTTVRTSAGVQLGTEVSIERIRLSRRETRSEQWPVLSSSAASQADVTGNLSVSGNMLLGATGTADGCLHVKNSAPETTAGVFETPSGKILSGVVDGSEKFSVNADGDLYVRGNVGIGTTSPGSKLDVKGDIQLQGDNAGNNASLNFKNNDTGAWWHWSHRGGNDSLEMRVRPSVTGSTTISLVMTASGNVGIGTPTPGYRLEALNTGFTVMDGTNVVANLISNQHSFLKLTPGGGMAPWGIFASADGVDRLGVVSYGAGTERFSVLRNGNVGIGTTTPSASLDVQGGDNSFRWGGDHSASNYIRLGDLQICWGRVQTPADSEYVEIKFPAPFVVAYDLVVSPAGGGAWRGSAMVASPMTFSGALVQAIPDQGYTGFGKPITYIAIGRWK